MRAAIPILYAHWEGFAKRACEAYLELVSRQGLSYKDLKTNFLAIACKGSIKEAGHSNQMQLYLNVVEFATYNQENLGKFSHAGAIDTQDNLNSKVLSNIFIALGFVCDDFFTSRFLLLDGSLLKSRNSIAHGDRTPIDDIEYNQLHTLVIELLDHLKIEIENASISEYYKRNAYL